MKPTLRITRIFRLARLTLRVCVGLLVAWLIFPRVSPLRQDRILRWWGRGILRALRVQPRVIGEVPSLEARHVLLAANHVSWLDIFALHAVKPVRFVAKSEIRHWPILGWLTARTGTLFIERERRRHAIHVMHEMRACLTNGFNVGIFPEGGSSSGDHIRSFHAALFQAATEQVRVLPVAIRYLDASGQRTEALAYADETSFPESLRSILRLSSSTVELNFEAPLDVSGHSRRELAAAAEQAIASRLRVPVLQNQPGTASDPPA